MLKIVLDFVKTATTKKCIQRRKPVIISLGKDKNDHIFLSNFVKVCQVLFHLSVNLTPVCILLGDIFPNKQGRIWLMRGPRLIRLLGLLFLRYEEKMQNR